MSWQSEQQRVHNHTDFAVEAPNDVEISWS